MNDLHYNREFSGAAGFLEAYDMSSGMWLPMSNRMREEEKERDYWRQLYPAEVKQIQRAVELACDQVDYEGSFLYDEYPDRVALQKMCDEIEQRMTAGVEERQEEISAVEYCPQCESRAGNRIFPPIQPGRPPMPPGPKPGPRPPMPPGPKPPMPPGPKPGPRPNPSWHNLIQLLLFDEISHRRRNRRRYWSF